MRHMKRDTSEFEPPEEENQLQETTRRPQRNQRNHRHGRKEKLLSAWRFFSEQQDEMMKVLVAKRHPTMSFLSHCYGNAWVGHVPTHGSLLGFLAVLPRWPPRFSQTVCFYCIFLFVFSFNKFKIIISIYF